MAESLSLDALFRRLNDLPTELVHRVMDFLQFDGILLLATCPRLTRLHDHTMTHPIYRKSFKSVEDLLDAGEYLMLFWKFTESAAPTAYHRYLGEIQSTHQDLCKRLHSDDFPARSSSFRTLTSYVFDHRSQVFHLIQPYSSLQLQTLASTSITSAKDLREPWKALCFVQARLNGIKARQLRRAADLLEANPDVLQVEKDPEPDPRRHPTPPKPQPDIAQEVAKLRSAAENVISDRAWRWEFSGSHYFCKVTIPVVPANKALAMFVDKVKKYPINPVVLAQFDEARWNADPLEDKLSHSNIEGNQTTKDNAACEPENKTSCASTLGRILTSFWDAIVKLIFRRACSIPRKEDDKTEDKTAKEENQKATKDDTTLSSMPNWHKWLPIEDAYYKGRYHKYPTDVAQAIHTVIKGMALVYVDADARAWKNTPVVYRTGYTPWSAEPVIPGLLSFDQRPYFKLSTYLQPGFHDSTGKFEQFLEDRHKLDMQPSLLETESLLRMFRPHDEREYEWVEAFVKAYRYLEKLP